MPWGSNPDDTLNCSCQPATRQCPEGPGKDVRLKNPSRKPVGRATAGDSRLQEMRLGSDVVADSGGRWNGVCGWDENGRDKDENAAGTENIEADAGAREDEDEGGSDEGNEKSFEVTPVVVVAICVKFAENLSCVMAPAGGSQNPPSPCTSVDQPSVCVRLCVSVCSAAPPFSLSGKRAFHTTGSDVAGVTWSMAVHRPIISTAIFTALLTSSSNDRLPPLLMLPSAPERRYDAFLVLLFTLLLFVVEEMGCCSTIKLSSISQYVREPSANRISRSLLFAGR